MMRGLVLAGGQSRRFGSDKALAIYKGESFLQRSVRILERMKLDPWVVGRPDVSYFFPSNRILYDQLKGKGPLAGIHAAMNKFPGDDWLVLTCDMPFLNEKALEDLVFGYKDDPVLTLYRSPEGRIEPFPGIYPYLLFAKIYKNLLTEKLAMHELIELDFKKNILPFNDDKKILENVNHPFCLESLN